MAQLEALSVQVEVGSPLTDLDIDSIANTLVDLLLARLAAKAPVWEPILDEVEQEEALPRSEARGTIAVELAMEEGQQNMDQRRSA